MGSVVVLGTLGSWRRLVPYIVLSAALSVAAVVLLTPVEIGVLGLLGSLSMRAFQTQRTWVTKSTAGMSYGSWVLLLINVTAWGVYGLRTNHWPLVATSGIVLISSVVLLLMVYRFRTREAVLSAP
jgi:uncharacterized protein with PQ loop repeat